MVLAQVTLQEGPVPAPLSHPESADTPGRTPVTHMRGHWLFAAVTAVTIAGSTAMAHGDRGAQTKRAAVVAAPAQAPVVVAHATTGRVYVDWAPLRGVDGY